MSTMRSEGTQVKPGKRTTGRRSPKLQLVTGPYSDPRHIAAGNTVGTLEAAILGVQRMLAETLDQSRRAELEVTAIQLRTVWRGLKSLIDEAGFAS